MQRAIRRLSAAMLAAPLLFAACEQNKLDDTPTSPRVTPQFHATVNGVTVTKTGAAYNRQGLTYDWTLEKTVTPASAQLAQGASATFTYTLAATRVAGPGSGGTGMSGQICLANANANAITITLVEDVLEYLDGTVWRIVPGFPKPVPQGGVTTLASGASHCFAYDFPFTPATGESYRNWASVNVTFSNGTTGNPETVSTPIPLDFTVAPTVSETDEAAALNDILTCPTGFTCSVNTQNWSLTGTSNTTYPVTVTNVSAPCGSSHNVVNTAKLTENDSQTEHTDNASVTVTTPNCTPRLTANKTATATWKKWVAYDWTLAKTVTPASANLATNASATFNYTLTATRVIATQSEQFTAAGQVCVTNGGDAAANGIAISDVLQHSTDGGATWVNNSSVTVNTSGHPTLAAGETHCYSYSGDFNRVAGAQYRNKATVSSTNTGGVETTQGFALPASPELTETDESAALTDALECPAGFSCDVVSRSWALTGSQTLNYSVTIKNESAPCGHTDVADNVANLTEGDSGTGRSAEASVTLTTPTCAPSGFQGCTPGYWKQKQHFGSWVGYVPTGTTASKYNTVFGVNLFSPSFTLLQALGQGGGGAARLGRHSTAALLNTANGGVAYGMTTAQVIAAVQQAVASGNYDAASDVFEKLNERQCPLGRNP